MVKNGKQTIAIMISFALMVFAVIGWMWTSLEGRMEACEQQTYAVGQQSAVLDARLQNIEHLLEEVRADVKAMRQERARPSDAGGNEGGQPGSERDRREAAGFRAVMNRAPGPERGTAPLSQGE